MPKTKEKTANANLAQHRGTNGILGTIQILQKNWQTSLPYLNLRLLVLLSILPALAINGCTKAPAAAEDSYLAVLTGKEQFLYYADDTFIPHETSNAATAEPMDVADIPGIFSPDSSYAGIERFTVTDLDGDGQKEVLLQITDVAGDAGGYMILRHEGSEIHGYRAYYKDFESLKTDGTFFYPPIPAMPDDGIGAVRFHENGYSILPLACSETSEDFKTVAYKVGQKPASEEEYLAAREEHEEKTDTVWYGFTEETIQKAFSSSPQKDN